jgi:hypothetical protein
MVEKSLASICLCRILAPGEEDVCAVGEGPGTKSSRGGVRGNVVVHAHLCERVAEPALGGCTGGAVEGLTAAARYWLAALCQKLERPPRRPDAWRALPARGRWSRYLLVAHGRITDRGGIARSTSPRR